MARSTYKGEPLGKVPPCLLCGGPGHGGRQLVLLGNGVSVWLCADHRSDAFMRRRGGRDVVASLARAWAAAGCLDGRRRRALELVMRRARDPRDGDLPGSYAWPALRREAEQLAAAGARIPDVVRAIQGRVRSGGGSRPPSERTIRRWVAEAGRKAQPGSDGQW